MKRRRNAVGLALLLRIVLSTLCIAQTVQAPAVQKNPPAGPFARIAIMRALDGHFVELEAGYRRHLEWHRQAKDTFAWYSYSVWASDRRPRSIIYATFGHTADELSHPVSPADDERDNVINVLPHAQYLGNSIYRFLPDVSRGNGIPTPTARAEYMTVELKSPADAGEFEASLPKNLQEETLWYRLVVGGDVPQYIRIRPRASLAAILDERGNRPDFGPDVGAIQLVSKITIETLSLRPDMLVNVTPEPVR